MYQVFEASTSFQRTVSLRPPVEVSTPSVMEGNTDISPLPLPTPPSPSPLPPPPPLPSLPSPPSPSPHLPHCSSQLRALQKVQTGGLHRQDHFILICLAKSGSISDSVYSSLEGGMKLKLASFCSSWDGLVHDILVVKFWRGITCILVSF